MSGEMRSGGQWYSSIVDNDDAGAPSENAALPVTLNLVVGVPN